MLNKKLLFLALMITPMLSAMEIRMIVNEFDAELDFEEALQEILNHTNVIEEEILEETIQEIPNHRNLIENLIHPNITVTIVDQIPNFTRGNNP